MLPPKRSHTEFAVGTRTGSRGASTVHGTVVRPMLLPDKFCTVRGERRALTYAARWFLRSTGTETLKTPEPSAFVALTIACIFGLTELHDNQNRWTRIPPNWRTARCRSNSRET